MECRASRIFWRPCEAGPICRNAGVIRPGESIGTTTISIWTTLSKIVQRRRTKTTGKIYPLDIHGLETLTTHVLAAATESLTRLSCCLCDSGPWISLLYVLSPPRASSSLAGCLWGTHTCACPPAHSLPAFPHPLAFLGVSRLLFLFRP